MVRFWGNLASHEWENQSVSGKSPENLQDIPLQNQKEALDYEFEDIMGFIPPKVHRSEEQEEKYEIYFIIKICKFSWEESKDQILTMEEDAISKRLKYLLSKL